MDPLQCMNDSEAKVQQIQGKLLLLSLLLILIFFKKKLL